MSYNNPTLDEIYLSLPLRENSLSEPQFFIAVPALKKLGLEDVEMRQDLVLPDDKNKKDFPFSTPRVRCWNKDKTKLVQLSQDRLIINQTKEYLGWTNFNNLIDETLNALKEEKLNLIITSLDLNTIDKFSVNKKKYRNGDWLNCNGIIIPKWYEDKADSFDLTIGSGFLEKDGYNRVFKIACRTLEEHVEIRIENKFHNLLNNDDELFDKLEVLHKESNKIFEDIITDKVRNEIMNSKK